MTAAPPASAPAAEPDPHEVDALAREMYDEHDGGPSLDDTWWQWCKRQPEDEQPFIFRLVWTAARVALRRTSRADAAGAEQMRKALEPFAEIGVWMFARPDIPDDEAVFEFTRLNAPPGVLIRGHFKAAHTAITGAPGAAGPGCAGGGY